MFFQKSLLCIILHVMSLFTLRAELWRLEIHHAASSVRGWESERLEKKGRFTVYEVTMSNSGFIIFGFSIEGMMCLSLSGFHIPGDPAPALLSDCNGFLMSTIGGAIT
jgi:hypothetical protein